MHSGYGIAADGKGEWSFGNDFARNVKNNFLILGEGDTFGINGRFDAPENKLILILVKQRQNIAWVCIIIEIIVIYL